MRTVEQLSQSTNPALVRAFGAIRRFVITLTDSALWQIAGVLMPDGRETMRAEVFSGVGIYARPPADVEAEAVALMAGGADAPVIVGIRDEATRAAVVGELEPDESALYNSQALVYVKADGTIEARSKDGTAIKLPTLADVEKIGTAIAGAVVVAGDGGASLKTTILGTLASSLHGVSGAETWPVGTTKLKAE